MSYSHLRGCWFSEMPQVRCHVHRSPGSKLRPLCFFPDMPPSPLLLSLFPQTYFHVILFTKIFLFSQEERQLTSVLSFLLWELTRLVFLLFIISNNGAITQVLIWAAALYESHPVLTAWVQEAAWECSFNHLRAPLPSGREKEESLSQKS